MTARMLLRARKTARISLDALRADTEGEGR